ncbi:MAG: hypothetical protein V2I33_17040 [Kangiellaceae bacterium]|nr:hypothetical protein [Kangiellaceae bacterium]
MQKLGYLEPALLTAIETSAKSEMLAYAALLGAIQALWREMPIATSLLGTFQNIIDY